MTDHYETRCPSCGGADEQGCYADCPTTVMSTLRAENKKLRAALEKISEYEIEGGCPCSACQHSAIARAALEEKQ